MSQQLRQCWFAYIVLVLNMQDLIVYGKTKRQPQNQHEQFPCYFIFGDSFSANGNDNGLDTFKSNYLPYGIDFLDGPTGRFSNGKIMVDIIAEKIGMKDYIRPYRTVGTNRQMLKGVNYASSGAILQLEIAGSKVNSISLGQQLKYHKKIVRRISNILGSKNMTKQYLHRCLLSVEIGCNDVFNNYIPNNDGSDPTPRQSPDRFAQYLVDHFFFNNLHNLHNFGAKKVVVFGLPSLGCSPAAIRMYGNGSNQDEHKCISVINKDIQLYNSKLRTMVFNLNNYTKNAQFTYIETSQAYQGFKNIGKACCETDLDGMCYSMGKSCNNRKDYFYWDGYRPTEAANIILANIAYNASVPSHAYPFNIHHLISNTTSHKS
ncbi:GDSL esterase/lipase At1g29670-like [Euphorbia lathyris]|uniref:GDSL esterase/lipase At1g29670-like n=1 Tax=Euphorbia lathyris TaxID=212925 RepID=UPI0033135D66